MPTNGEYNTVEKEKKRGEMLSAQSQHDSSRTNIFFCLRHFGWKLYTGKYKNRLKNTNNLYNHILHIITP